MQLLLRHVLQEPTEDDALQLSAIIYVGYTCRVANRPAFPGIVLQFLALCPSVPELSTQILQFQYLQH